MMAALVILSMAVFRIVVVVFYLILTKFNFPVYHNIFIATNESKRHR